jgi:hypothetical protein
MKTFSKVRISTLTACAVAGLLAFAGCGGDDLGTRYPVSGTVTYQGKPVAKGTITFMSDKGTRGAAGEIKDGAYTLTAVNEGDGAFPGNYKVVVEALDVDMSGVVEQAKKLAEKNKIPYNESMIDQQSLAKARAKAKSAVPAKYAKANTSGLTAVVKEESNTHNFELTD